VITAYRVTVVAFWLLFVAALVDHAAPLAYAFGLVAIAIPCAVWWMRWDRETRSYTTVRPPAIDDVSTVDLLPGEPSQTRQIRGRTTAAAKEHV